MYRKRPVLHPAVPVGEPLEVAAEIAASAIPDDKAFVHLHDGAHRTVRAIFDQLRDGPLENAMLAWRLLGMKFPRYFTDEQRTAAAGLIEYYRLTGRMGGNGYDDWVRELPEPHPYCSKTKLKRVLGPSWDDVKRNVFGLPARDSASVTLASTNAPFADELLERSVLTWADEHDEFCDCRLLQRCYLGWAERELAGPATRFENLPATYAPFKRWGGWRGTLLHCGLLERRLKRPDGTRETSGLLAARDLYAEDRLIDAITTAAGVLGPRIGVYRYQRWVDEQIERALDAGRMLVLPHHTTILGHFKHWPRALHAAGVITEIEMHERLRDEGFSDDELIDAAVEAQLAFGTGISPAQYKGWRAERRRIAREDGAIVKVPTEATIRPRLGGGTQTPSGNWRGGDWDQAMAFARRKRPDVHVPTSRRPPARAGRAGHDRRPPKT